MPLISTGLKKKTKTKQNKKNMVVSEYPGLEDEPKVHTRLLQDFTLSTCHYP